MCSARNMMTTARIASGIKTVQGSALALPGVLVCLPHPLPLPHPQLGRLARGPGPHP